MEAPIASHVVHDAPRAYCVACSVPTLSVQRYPSFTVWIPESEIALILCKGGSSIDAFLPGMLMKQLSEAFNVTVRGYSQEIIYENPFTNNRFVSRDLTSVGKNGGQGRGYPCAVTVEPALAGAHLAFDRHASCP